MGNKLTSKPVPQPGPQLGLELGLEPRFESGLEQPLEPRLEPRLHPGLRLLARYTGILKKYNLLSAESYLRFFSILAEVMDAFSKKYGIYGLPADKNYLFFVHSAFVNGMK